MRPGDMEQIDDERVEMAIAKGMLWVASLCAAFVVGFACAYLMWGA
jgi:hypothetical protein